MNEEEKLLVEELRASGKSYREIAEITGIKQSTISSYLLRTKKNIITDTATIYCKECGVAIAPGKVKRNRTFCSSYCRSKWWAQRKHLIKRGPDFHRSCKYCGSSFITDNRKNGIYCSRECHFADKEMEKRGVVNE